MSRLLLCPWRKKDWARRSFVMCLFEIGLRPYILLAFLGWMIASGQDGSWASCIGYRNRIGIVFALVERVYTGMEWSGVVSFWT